MRAYLEVADGRYAGTTITLDAGDTCQVGARLGVDLFLPDDASLAPIHFALLCEHSRCQLRECESGKPTWLNGQLVKRATLNHQDWIVAGETLFWFFADDQPITGIETPVTRLLDHLDNLEEPLYALVDASLDPRLEALIEAAPGQACNFQQAIPEMEHVMSRPWLIELPKASSALTRLVRAAWGKGQCVFLTSEARFDLLRNHFGRLLEMNHAGGADAGFRFFDPRVLRLLLSESEPRQAERLFRNVSSFLVEAQLPHSLLEFQWRDSGVHADSRRLSTPKSRIPSQPQFQSYFAAARNGSFNTTLLACLREHLPVETEGHSDQELLALIAGSDQEATRYGIHSQAARAQYASLAVALEYLPGRIPGVDKCLQTPGLPGEEKLRLFIENFNYRRG